MRCSCGGRCPRCSGEDAAERDADRAAMAMGHRTPPSVAAAAPPPPAPAQPALLQHGGAPLPSALRDFYEPRFGHDFADVRLHADAHAHAWSEKLGAAAFTVGRHVWLGRGANAKPGFLMAHELAHVVQQRGATPQVQRQPAPSQPATPSGPPGCKATQTTELTAALAQGDRWLVAASAALRAYAAAPKDAAQAATAGMLRLHFHRADASLAQSVADVFDAVHARMSQGTAGPVRCVPDTEAPCNTGSDAAGERRSGQIKFCAAYFGVVATVQANTAVHEFAHLFAGLGVLEDRAYRFHRRYEFLSPAEAFDNAQSFSNLAEDLGSGVRGQSLAAAPAPVDTRAGCTGDGPARALALAEGWNFNGFRALVEPDLRSQPGVQGLLTRLFGNAAAVTAAVPRATRAMAFAGQALEHPLDLACHANADAPCSAGAQVMPEAPAGARKAVRWHLCPGWAGLADDVARGESVYRALLQGLGRTSAADATAIIAFGREVDRALLGPARPIAAPKQAAQPTPSATQPAPSTGTPPAQPSTTDR